MPCPLFPREEASHGSDDEAFTEGEGDGDTDGSDGDIDTDEEKDDANDEGEVEAKGGEAGAQEGSGGDSEPGMEGAEEVRLSRVVISGSFPSTRTLRRPLGVRSSRHCRHLNRVRSTRHKIPEAWSNQEE